MRWAALLIAFTACKQDKPLGRELHMPPSPPAPIRVELGDCSRSSDAFISGEAIPEPAYWIEVMGDVGGGYGTFGTFGHGGGTWGGQGPGFGRSSPQPLITINKIEVTAADAETWRAITRRYVKRNILKLTYCYEKQLLEHPSLAGKVVATLSVDKSGKVTSTITETFDATVSTCMKGVYDGLEVPKPDAGFTATVPIMFTPSSEERARAREAADDATAVGTAHPLAGRESEIEACLRATPAAPGAGVIDFQFGLDGKPKTVTLVGAQNECIQKLATTAKNTSSAKNVRCAFATGDAPPSELPTLELLAGGTIKFGGTPTDFNAIRSLVQDAVKNHTSTWAAVTQRGPIAIAPEMAVPMRTVKSVIQEVRRANFATVFVVPHVFGGTRLLGARVPFLVEPTGRTKVSTALHVVTVHRTYVDIDDVPVASAAELMTALERMRRDDGPVVQIRFDDDATFGSFAQVVDMAVEAGLTAWEL